MLHAPTFQLMVLGICFFFVSIAIIQTHDPLFAAALIALLLNAIFVLRASRTPRPGASMPANEETFSDGDSVEVDCSACGKFNRVPMERLRDKPHCGQCKQRLMPGKRVVVCFTSPLEGSLRAELNGVWKDEERFWQALADHAMLRGKERRDAKEPGRKAVN